MISDRPVQVTEEDVALAASVGRALTRLLRTASRAKTHAHAHGSRVDFTAFPLLGVLAERGPLRSTALADAVLSDPSTVSRQVSHLVELGLVQRQPDPHDRRACLLVTTAAGDEALAAHRRRRDEYIAELMRDWPAGDRRRLADLIERLAEDLGRQLQAAGDHEVPAVGGAR